MCVSSKEKKTKVSKIRPKFRHKHPIIFYSILFTLVCMSLGIFLVVKYTNDVLQDIPVINEEMLMSQGSSNMYAKDGKLIWSDTEFRRDYIKKDDIPDLYKDMLLSVEDREFYEHNGFSEKGILNAGFGYMKELMGEGKARGGSTIEQQLVKNIAFSTQESDRTVERKFKELFLAIQLDKNFEKDQILEWYINKIEMGENSLGANTIAITYYGKSLSEFDEYTPENLAKMAYIAGIPKSPSEYNLYDNPEGSKQRRDDVLYAALDNGIINKAQYNAATEVPIDEDLKERHWRNNEVLKETAKYSAFVDTALKQVKELGYDYKETPMEIHTTLDRKQNDWLQKEVDKEKYVQTDEQQYAVTIIDNETRELVAQVGGRNNDDPYAYNRATQRSRSSGSIIKPFLDYIPAFEYLGYGTDYKLSANNYVYPGTNLIARNYGQYEYGNQTIKESLIQSFNTPAIRLLDEHVGSANAKQMMENLNMDVKDNYGAGDALGLDVSTYDIANAFSTLANNGVYQQSKAVDHIVFSDGSKKDIVFDDKQAMRPSTAYVTLQVLNGVTKDNDFAESGDIKSYKGYATKTGSVAYDDDFFIQNNLPDYAHSDGWIGGTTRSYAVTLWTGYDNPNEPNHFLYEEQNDQRQSLYRNIMLHLNKGKNTDNFKQPDGVETYKNGKNTHWRSVDLDYERYIRPNTFNVEYNDVDKVLRQFKNGDTITIKESKDKPYQLPKDYKQGEWKDDLSDEDKENLQRWLNGESDKPTEKDVPSDVYIGQ